MQRTQRWASLAGATSILALALAASAVASSDRITRGEAQAVFEAATTGGAAIRAHAASLNGSPAAVTASDGVRINAFLPWNGRHYCVLDWHVIAINLTIGNAPGDTFTREELAVLAAATEVVFTLDGVPLDVTRTPVRPDHDFPGLSDALTFTAGRVVSPEELPAREHTLTIVISDPGGTFETSTISLVVDPDGTGACL